MMLFKNTKIFNGGLIIHHKQVNDRYSITLSDKNDNLILDNIDMCSNFYKIFIRQLFILDQSDMFKSDLAEEMPDVAPSFAIYIIKFIINNVDDIGSNNLKELIRINDVLKAIEWRHPGGIFVMDNYIRLAILEAFKIASATAIIDFITSGCTDTNFNLEINENYFYSMSIDDHTTVLIVSPDNRCNYYSFDYSNETFNRFIWPLLNEEVDICGLLSEKPVIDYLLAVEAVSEHQNSPIKSAKTILSELRAMDTSYNDINVLQSVEVFYAVLHSDINSDIEEKLLEERKRLPEVHVGIYRESSKNAYCIGVYCSQNAVRGSITDIYYVTNVDTLGTLHHFEEIRLFKNYEAIRNYILTIDDKVKKIIATLKSMSHEQALIVYDTLNDSYNLESLFMVMLNAYLGKSADTDAFEMHKNQCVINALDVINI